MAVLDCDGSPTAFGPPGSNADDYLPRNLAASHDVVMRPDGKPVIGENGYYVSPTSWQSGPADKQSSYVDAKKVPYVAMTKKDREKGVRNGDFVLLTNQQTGKQIWAVVADYAASHPENHAEISFAAAQALGLRFSKDHKGLYGNISMEFFPGTGTGVFPRGGNAEYIAQGPQGNNINLANGGGSNPKPKTEEPVYHNPPPQMRDVSYTSENLSGDRTSTADTSFFGEIGNILSKIWNAVVSFFGSLFHGSGGSKPNTSASSSVSADNNTGSYDAGFRPSRQYARSFGVQPVANRGQYMSAAYDVNGSYFSQVQPVSGPFNRGASVFRTSYAPVFAQAAMFNGGRFNHMGRGFNNFAHFRA